MSCEDDLAESSSTIASWVSKSNAVVRHGSWSSTVLLLIKFVLDDRTLRQIILVSSLTMQCEVLYVVGLIGYRRSVYLCYEGRMFAVM